MNEHLSSQQLTDLAEGLLPTDRREALQAHLAGCLCCREALAARQALVGQLSQGLPAYLERVTLPPTLRWEKVRDRVPSNKRKGQKMSVKMWYRMRTATASLAVLVILIGLGIGLNALFQQMASPASSVEEIPVAPGPVVELAGHLPAGDSPFGGYQPFTITVRAALPQVPDSVPLYRVEPALEQISPQDVHQWAEWLGMGSVRVYQKDESGMMGEAGYVGVNADWEALYLSPEYFSFISGDFPMSWIIFGMGDSSATSVDKAAARAAAEVFLNRLAPYLITVEGATEMPQITFYLTENDMTRASLGTHGYQVEPVLDGIHVALESGPGNTILIGPEGQVSAAMLTPLRLTPTGETVSPRPPEAVLNDFLSGESGLLRGSSWGSGGTPTEEMLQSFYRSLTYREGQAIVVDGWVEFMRGLEGEADLLLLHTLGASSAFILEGADLTETPDPSLIQVWGTLSGAEAPHVWRLQVERLETASEGQVSWAGEVERRADGLWLKTRGQEFLLPDPPEEIFDGARVSVMGMPDTDDPNRLEWRAMTLLPAGGKGGLGMVEAQGFEVVVEVVGPIAPFPTATSIATPTPFSATVEGDALAPTPPALTTPPAPATATPVPPPAMMAPVAVEVVKEVTIPGAPPSVGPPATPPAWWGYQPGDEVTVEGLLHIHGHQLSDGSARVWANLTIEGPAGETIPYLPLAGDRLVELLALDQLHVRARGQILSNEQAAEKQAELVGGPFDQVLWVEEVEQLWPEEKKAVYSGPVRVESVDGQEISLLDDQFSGQTFALLDENLTPHLQSYQEDASLTLTGTLIGVLEPGQEIGGYSVLRVVELAFSEDQGEDQVDRLKQRLENPLQEIGPGRGGPTEVIIEEIKLAYRATMFFHESPEGTQAEPMAAELFYFLIGHSPDGQYQVTLRLEVAEPPAQP